jgi:hypothetical protein
MFRSFLGRLALLATIAGLAISPSVSWATTIQHPFSSYTSHPASLSVINAGVLGLTTTNTNYNTTAKIQADPSGYYLNLSSNIGSTTYTSTLDISNNDLIIHPLAQNETSAMQTYRAVYNMLNSGADQGAYDGKGIKSGIVNLDATAGQGDLAVGVMLNDDGAGSHGDGSGNPLWGGANSDLGSFDGNTSLSQYDTIVKYTFIGDLFLEGAVSQTDEQIVFANLGLVPANNTTTTQAFQNGDFFYQSASGGPVSQTADQITFANLANQANYPYTLAQPSSGLGSGAVAVPEPASIVTALIGIFGIAACVRRLRSAK